MKLSELSLDEFSRVGKARVETLRSQCLRNIPSVELKDALEYSCSNGGKHLRPLLVYATGAIFDASLENLDIPACAVEFIHTYSLIHDDLPCMDNADLRRGKPTCHKVHGEAMAVLSGDALHTLAFQIITNQPAELKADRRLQMIKTLAQACGPFGMEAGQAMDISVLNDATISTHLLEDIYKLKTGALITASIELGRLASKDNDEINQRALIEFGNAIGLAFQIQDDILDIEAETNTLGKQQGIDNLNNKVTYPKLAGMNQAKEKVESLYENALQAINYLGHRAQLLRDLTNHMLVRKK